MSSILASLRADENKGKEKIIGEDIKEDPSSN